MRTDKRFHALDGLRGIAVLAVLARHEVSAQTVSLWWQWPLLAFSQIGWMGVDLFFVLSGFLITGILLDHQKSQNYFLAFYWRRFLRIWPVYFLLLFLITMLVPFLNPAVYSSWSFSADGVSPYWLFLSNLRLLQDLVIGFSAVFRLQYIQMLGPTWTLAVEEQFYLTWSIVVRFLSRRALALAAVSAIIFGISLRFWLLANPLISQLNYGEISDFTLTHLDGLFVGVLLRLGYDGLASKRTLSTFAKSWWLFSILVVGVLAFDHFIASEPFIIFNEYGPAMMRIGLTLVAVAFGSIMMHGVLIDGWVRRVFESPLLKMFGAYSYFMYLFHLSIIKGLNHYLFKGLHHYFQINTMPQPFLFILQVLAVTLIAAASYRWIEAPMLRMKERIPYQ